MFSKFIKPVYAHCDVPCGIYETDTMTHAAETCLRMVEKINELGIVDNTEKQNNFTRMVETKEKHSQIVKDQLYLLWSDYFKIDHLAKFPDLHTIFWMAAKQASRVKQTVSVDECQKLLAQVKIVAGMFAESKK